MIDSIKEKIDMQKEVLSTLPTNNKKNLDKYTKQINDYKNEFILFQKEIITEVENRKKMFDHLEENKNINILSMKLKTLEEEISFLNIYNSSYEKLGLDKVIYDISKFYKFDLDKVNKDILSAFNIFKEVGITLSYKDFSYSSFLEEYMKVFFDNINNLDSDIVKKTFESIYWKCSDLLVHVEVTLKYLYFKNKKIFDNYILERVKKISAKYPKGLINTYQEVKNEYDDLCLSDTYLIIESFKNKNLNTSDFSYDKIKRSYDELIINTDSEINYDKIKNFYYGLEEFLDYNKITYLIENMREVCNKLKDYKSNIKNLFKELNKNESKIHKINKKLNFYKKYHMKIKDLPSSVNELIKANKKIYDDIDDCLFMDRLKANINNNLSYIDAIKACYGNYLYLVKCIKKSDSSAHDDSLSSKIEEVKKLYYSSHLTFLKHINIFENKNVNMVISDGYSLAGFRLKPEDFDNESGILLLKQLAYKIIVYNYISKSKFTFDDIDFYVSINNK